MSGNAEDAVAVPGSAKMVTAAGLEATNSCLIGIAVLAWPESDLNRRVVSQNRLRISDASVLHISPSIASILGAQVRLCAL
jgi:hypothetical protein